jgi:Fe-S cluster assembly protein SufD
MVEVTDQLGRYLDQFARFEKARSEATWIHPLRQEAMQRFAERGFPATTDEDWRFTSVAALTNGAFGLAAPATVPPEISSRFDLGDWRRSQIVFVNGRYSREHSSLRSLPSGALVGSLGEALKTKRELVEPHLTRLTRHRENAFAALNTAFLTDGAFVFLPKGALVEDPIHLLFLSAAGERAGVSHPRSLIVAEEGSQARIVESYAGVDRDVYFTNAVTEVVVGESANLDHYKLQRESEQAFHIATLQLHLERSAAVSTHSISLGGKLVRNDINAVLDGDGGDLALNGLYAVGGEQHVDHHTVIDHAKPHCTSRELYKGILSDHARAVFNGRIIVRPNAQKTDARQTNKNLLLSDDALVNTNPQLEINADDVKCAHGATIGQLDADVLFYLRSRGIDLETARHLLTYGFMSDISARIQIDAIRSELEGVLFAGLPSVSHGALQ